MPKAKGNKRIRKKSHPLGNKNQIVNSMAALNDVYMTPSENLTLSNYRLSTSEMSDISRKSGLFPKQKGSRNIDNHEEENGNFLPNSFGFNLSQSTKRVTRSQTRAQDLANSSTFISSPESIFQTTKIHKKCPGRPLNDRNAMQKANSENGEDTIDIYSFLKNMKAPINFNTIVVHWIKSYENNKEAALMHLMQFFINVSGCKSKTTPEMAQMEYTTFINKMEEFNKKNTIVPLLMKEKSHGIFHGNFCNFIQILVKLCQNSIIHDQFFMNKIMYLLTSLSNSDIRAFRYTATLAVMKLMTALVDVILLRSKDYNDCLRQYKIEKLQTRDELVQSHLKNKLQEIQTKMDEIKNMISCLFQAVFVHRYRDSFVKIRFLAMDEIGTWMKKFPDFFLGDIYLKYIGETLNDRAGIVRLKCLQTLQSLYCCEEFVEKLNSFTNKYKECIISMISDKNYDAAVEATKLMISILTVHSDILKDEYYEDILQLVYAPRRGVAQVAGEYLIKFVISQEETSVVNSKNRQYHLSNTKIILDLARFFTKSKLSENSGAFLVDSLIESNPIMKEWKCMTDLLLEQNEVLEEPLSKEEESSLIELMVNCVQQAATGEIPIGRISKTKKVNSTQHGTSNVFEDRKHLTEHFIMTLIPLLEKFCADYKKMSILLSIPQYFDLDLFMSKDNLVLFLKKLEDIVSLYTESEVLEACSKTLKVLCTDKNAIHTHCNMTLSFIINKCVNCYKNAIEEWRNLMECETESNANETLNIINSMKKLFIFLKYHNLNNSIIIDLFDNLSICLEESAFPGPALVYFIKCCYFSISWSVIKLEHKTKNGKPISNDVDILRKRLHAFIDLCENIIANEYDEILRETAYSLVCDLLIIFSEQFYSVHNKDEAKMQLLVYEPTENLCQILNLFVQHFVFVQINYDEEDEKENGELYKRRDFLASYCKLIIYNVIPIIEAADIFKHYVKFYNDYGYIIKLTLDEVQQINDLDCALSIAKCLQNLFKEIVYSDEKFTRNRFEFSDLKELAKKFVLFFGVDRFKNRKSIQVIHLIGIEFVLCEWYRVKDINSTPPNIIFFEILEKFTSVLIQQDKNIILQVLEEKISLDKLSSLGENWDPLLYYHNALVHRSAENISHSNGSPNTRKRKYD